MDSTTNTTLQNVAWSKDYFTTARPWTQKGAEVTVPVMAVAGGAVTSKTSYIIKLSNSTQTTDPVEPFCKLIGDVFNDEAAAVKIFKPLFDKVGFGVETSLGDSNPLVSWLRITFVSGDSVPLATPDSFKQISCENTAENSLGEAMYRMVAASPGQSGAVSVQDLRLATALQRMQEARAKYGSRYIDYLAYYGVKCSDARLQLPEYFRARFTPCYCFATNARGSC